MTAEALLLSDISRKINFDTRCSLVSRLSSHRLFIGKTLFPASSHTNHNTSCLVLSSRSSCSVLLNSFKIKMKVPLIRLKACHSIREWMEKQNAHDMRPQD